MTKSEVRPRGRTRTGRRIEGVVAALAMASGLVVGPASLPALAYPAQLLPTTGAYFGSWVAPRGSESVQQAIARIESEVGRKLAIDHQYYKWNSNIPTSHQSWDVNNGRIPFVNWNAANTGGSVVRWSAIANGSQDAWIRTRADAFKAFGSPIYLTFHHEPEDDLSKFGTAADYANAFRHIVTVFRSRGVTNVAFVWTMMSWTFDPRSGRDPNSYYPGDSYVDFIGSDGYNWYPGRAGDVWNSFATIFASTRAFALAHRKPWMAVEYGVQEDRTIAGRKGQWFRDALTTIKSWPELKAVMYYDQNKVYPWQTDTSSTSISGYRTLANDPYLRPGSVGGTTAPPPPSPVPPPPAGPTLYNSLDAGPVGAPVTATSSTRAVANTPFSAIATTNGASLTYDNTHSRGVFSAKHVLTSRSDSYYQWSGARSVWFGHLYVWFDSLPSGDLRLVRAASAGVLRVAIDLLRSGTLRVVDQQNNQVLNTTSAIATRRWIRIEFSVNHSTGTVQIRLFNTITSTTPTQVVTSAPGRSIGSSADQFQFGRSGNQSFPVTFWTDDPAMASSAYPAP
jgi:hypothetical protein